MRGLVFKAREMKAISGKRISATRRAVTVTAIFMTLIAAALFASSGPLGAQEEGAKVERAKAALEKWVETRRVLSKERRDWAEGKEMLLSRIDLVKREIESLRSRIGDAEQSVAEADKKRADLLEENEKLKEASAELAGVVILLERRTQDLLKRLPDPIRERVKPLSQRLPANPDETRLSLSERFQNVVGILNEVDKFNREISITSEVRALPDGTTVEVTALYVGIGQAFYASTNGRAAGVGTPSEDGWLWTPADEAAPWIAEAIAILKNEQIAGFVRLPVRIDG